MKFGKQGVNATKNKNSAMQDRWYLPSVLYLLVYDKLKKYLLEM